MAEKKKILFISDHQLIPSGVGLQAKYLIEGLLATGRYKFVCLGGAIQHPDYRPQKVFPEKYGDDWIIFPVNGHGDKQIVRKMLLTEKPDAVFIFTDPRFFVWLWEMEDEIRSIAPLLYWHVWDNDPSPDFNRPFYDSNDHIAALSLKTYGLLQDIGHRSFSYISHAVDRNVFKPLPREEIEKYKHDKLGTMGLKKFMLFWNNRNARRKQTGDVVATFAKFSREVGGDNVVLMMHTQPNDPEGQDVAAVARKYDVGKQIIMSSDRVPPEDLNMMYNAADCTINIASNEGFGLSTLESMMAGTPIIVHMTGGLQFQIGDWWKNLKDFSDQSKLTSIAKKAWASRSSGQNMWTGIPVFTSSRSCTGSQQIPYIYDDRVCHDDVVKALTSMYKYALAPGGTRSAYDGISKWADKTFSIELMVSEWDLILHKKIAEFGGRDKFSVINI